MMNVGAWPRRVTSNRSALIIPVLVRSAKLARLAKVGGRKVHDHRDDVARLGRGKPGLVDELANQVAPPAPGRGSPGDYLVDVRRLPRADSFREGARGPVLDI